MCTPNNNPFLTMESKIITIGIFSFILFTLGESLSLYIIIKEEDYHIQFETTNYLQHVFDMDLDKSIIVLVAGLFCVIHFVGMISSVLLIIGMKKNKSGFVLAYFGYGAMFTILMILSALLELLQYYWKVALSTIGFTAVYIQCLVVVHKVYDLMQKGFKFGLNGHNLIENES